jgi:hypothetical protein
MIPKLEKLVSSPYDSEVREAAMEAVQSILQRADPLS